MPRPRRRANTTGVASAMARPATPRYAAGRRDSSRIGVRRRGVRPGPTLREQIVLDYLAGEQRQTIADRHQLTRTAVDEVLVALRSGGTRPREIDARTREAIIAGYRRGATLRLLAEQSSLSRRLVVRVLDDAGERRYARRFTWEEFDGLRRARAAGAALSELADRYGAHEWQLARLLADAEPELAPVVQLNHPATARRR